MRVRELLGYEMWECNPAEIKKLWYSDKENRWRLTTPAEVDAHLLDGPEEVAAWIAAKVKKPGEYLDKCV